MFDKSIIETDNFLNVSLSAKAIYFLLGMEADDEGFVSPQRILRLYGGEKGDLKNLIDTGLIIPFKSGVVVITDWNQNNWLDTRRIKPTQYQEEKKLLTLNDCRKYVLSHCLASAKPEERSIEEKRTEEIAETAEWDFKKYLEGMESNKRRDLGIVALYWKFKKFNFTNQKQAEVELKRSLRAAKNLEPFEDEKIWKTMEWLSKYADFKWVLETVGKYITEELSKLKIKQ